MKTQKSIKKRFKILKKKIIVKRTGRDHFNAKESGKITRKKRKNRLFSKVFAKTILKYV